MAVLSGYDIAQRRLPNMLTLPGAGVILAAAALAGRGAPAAAGSAALAAVYLAVHLGAPAAMGAGDVKLAFGLGALTGCFGVAVWSVAALAAPLLTAAWSLLAVARRRGPTVAHGPAMCAASAVAVALAAFV